MRFVLGRLPAWASSDAMDQGGEVAQSVDRDSARMDENASWLVLNGVNWPCGLWQTKTECGKHERSASAPGFLRRCLDQEERQLPRLAIGGGQGSGRHWDGAVWEAQGLAEARWTSKDNAAQARRKAVSAQLACECACYGAKHFSFAGCQTSSNALAGFGIDGAVLLYRFAAFLRHDPGSCAYRPSFSQISRESAP